MIPRLFSKCLLAGCFVTLFTSQLLAEISVKGVQIIGIELRYELKNGPDRFCFLIAESVKDTTWLLTNVDYWFVPDGDESSEPPLYWAVYSADKYVIHEIPPLSVSSGRITISEEGSPTGDSARLLLFKRGFDCTQVPDLQAVYAKQDIDTRLRMPIGLSEDAMLTLKSEVFEVEFRRQN